MKSVSVSSVYRIMDRKSFQLEDQTQLLGHFARDIEQLARQRRRLDLDSSGLGFEASGDKIKGLRSVSRVANNGCLTGS